MKRQFFNTFFVFLITIILFSFTRTSNSADLIIDTDTTWESGEYTYDDVLITNGATLTFNGAVSLNAINLTIDLGSSISADDRGYGSESGPGTGGSSYEGGGAGYGGAGGSSWSGAFGGSTYGSLTEPTDLGSGGGLGSGKIDCTAAGGAGGGAIRLAVAGTLTVDGSLTANGQKGRWKSNVYGDCGGGGGSGGSIYITANTLAGTGVISANGGDGGGDWNLCGGGGGGRIAIYYDTNTFTGTTFAYGGTGYEVGGAGTIFKKCSTDIFGDLLIDNGGLKGAMTYAEYFESLDELTVVDGGRLELSIDIVDLTISKISVTNQGELDLTGFDDLTCSQIKVSNQAKLAIAGCENLTSPQITVANQGELDLSTLQNLTANNLSTNEGALVHVAKVVTVENLELGSDVRINHPAGEVVEMTVGGDLIIDDGASITASIDLSVPGDLTIASGSSINADDRGYGSDNGPGAGGSAHYGGGAGYGGAGGSSDYPGGYGGSPYGSPTEPTDLGSGGGLGQGGLAGSAAGGDGGGALRLVVAGTLTVDGSLTANGHNGGWHSNVYGSTGGGGGSGGSIYITADTLAGTGMISANGGDGGYGEDHLYRPGGGGGGRIAIYYDTNAHTGTISVSGGSGYEAGQEGTILIDSLMNAPDTDIILSEKSSTQSTLIETVLSQTALIDNVTITGDLLGTLDFINFEMVSIESGSFAGKGFSKGHFEATLEGVSYTGEWKGILFLRLRPDERKIYLKGAISGEISAIAEGYLTESVPESGIYDQYQATWKIGCIRTETVSGTIGLAGTISYQDGNEYSSTELYALQTYIEGIALGQSTGSFNSVINHVRIVDDDNPYYGEGFSIISYVSDSGSGEGWTYDKLISPGIVELQGLFTGPVFGIANGVLFESESPRTLLLKVYRVDLGLPPMADLWIKVWGPGRVSPGQTVNYNIEYRNDGLKAADDVIVFYALDPLVKYISASTGDDYDDFYHEVSWNLGKIPAKDVGHLSVKVEVEWGLPWGTELDYFSHIIDIEVLSMKTQSYAIETFNSTKGNAGINGIATPKPSNVWNNWRLFGYNANFKPIHVYGKGMILDASDVDRATPIYSKIPISGYQNIIIDDDGTKWYVYFTPNENNGLTKDEIINGDYDTVYAYSGGTRTAITAILHKNLKCKRLVMISPNSGSSDKEIFKWELEQILKKHSDMEIVIYQSEKDNLVPGTVHFYPKGKDKVWFDKINVNKERIKVNPKTLDVDGKKIKEIEIYENEINTKTHTALDDYIKTLFDGKEGTSSPTSSTTATARDPNIKYGPEGYINAGQTLDYKVEYENEGEGIAFGVYFTDTLDEDLDDSTLEIGPVISTLYGSVIADPGTYNPATRTITWFVGEAGPGEGGYADFSASVRSDAPDCTEVINFATVYFPSVPEETRTNGIVSVVGLDTDGDGLTDDIDNCPYVSNIDQTNSDSDSHGDACDNCWYENNPDQADSNGNCPPSPYSSDPECGDACEAVPTTTTSSSTASSTTTTAPIITTTTIPITTTIVLSTTTTIIPTPECEVTIEPPSAHVLHRGTLQFNAITSCDGEVVAGDYLWDVDSTIGSIINEESGLYKAGTKAGTDTVRVIDAANGDTEATAEVIVSLLWPLAYDKMWGAKKDKNLILLRIFRDEVLLNTEVGGEYVSMLYDNSFEIAILLLQEPSLTSQTREVIDELLHTVESLLYNDDMIISQNTIENIESLLDNYETKASPKLKTAIKKLKKDINRGEIFEQLGITISK